MNATRRYVPNVSKALERILWITSRRPGLDVYHIAKSAFFADKMHVATYGRPICGDSYAAAPFGPLPQVIYNLLRHDPIEMTALDSNGDLPFSIDRKHRVYPSRDANARHLSASDNEALEHGIACAASKTFDELYREKHADPAYINADGADGLSGFHPRQRRPQG